MISKRIIKVGEIAVIFLTSPLEEDAFIRILSHLKKHKVFAEGVVYETKITRTPIEGGISVKLSISMGENKFELEVSGAVNSSLSPFYQQGVDFINSLLDQWEGGI